MKQNHEQRCKKKTKKKQKRYFCKSKCWEQVIHPLTNDEYGLYSVQQDLPDARPRMGPL